MNKLLVSMLLALCAGSVQAQSDTTVAKAGEGDKAKAEAPLTAEQKSADSFCLRQTGSHLRSIANRPHSERAVQCVNAPGRVYTREDIERTGQTTTREVLTHIDPSIR